MKENIVKTKSFAYAVNAVQLYKELIKNKEFVMSNQFLRSSTSVGANVCESANSFSKRDFIFKLTTSQKECDESIFWLELMNATDFINDDRFNELKNQAEEILRILKSSIITAKKNLNQD